MKILFQPLRVEIILQYYVKREMELRFIIDYIWESLFNMAIQYTNCGSKTIVKDVCSQT